MGLTPDDIEQQVFKERFRGYDQDEVDRFLDRVAGRIAELSTERDDLARRLREVELRAAEGFEAETLLKRTLVTAQRTADEAVAEARSQAEQTLADARQEAETLLEDARLRSQGLLAQAREQARLVHAAIEDLGRFRADYRERVRAVVADQLALLERVGELPELPADLEALAAGMARIGAAGDAVEGPLAGGREG